MDFCFDVENLLVFGVTLAILYQCVIHDASIDPLYVPASVSTINSRKIVKSTLYGLGKRKKGSLEGYKIRYDKKVKNYEKQHQQSFYDFTAVYDTEVGP